MLNGNDSYNALCELTTAIVAEWRAANREWASRPLAFAEACKRRPDLRDTAVRPGGQWVNPAAHADEPPPPKDKQPPQPIEDRSAEAVRQAKERHIGTRR
jgi:hypothetical protein